MTNLDIASSKSTKSFSESSSLEFRIVSPDGHSWLLKVGLGPCRSWTSSHPCFIRMGKKVKDVRAEGRIQVIIERGQRINLRSQNVNRLLFLILLDMLRTSSSRRLLKSWPVYAVSEPTTSASRTFLATERGEYTFLYLFVFSASSSSW